jgi:hypothetical protein
MVAASGSREYCDSRFGRRSSAHRLSPRRTPSRTAIAFVNFDSDAVRGHSRRWYFERPYVRRPWQSLHQFTVGLATEVPRS